MHSATIDTRPKWWQRLGPAEDAGDTRAAFPEISESAAIDDLLEVMSQSLQRCGFQAGEFSLRLIAGRSPTHPPNMLVELDAPDALVWDFTNHLETYLVDRVHRHSGFLVHRIVFTPRHRPGLDLAEMRDGVRTVWAALQARRGQRTPAADPNATYPNLGRVAGL